MGESNPTLSRFTAGQRIRLLYAAITLSSPFALRTRRIGTGTITPLEKAIPYDALLVVDTTFPITFVALHVHSGGVEPPTFCLSDRSSTAELRVGIQHVTIYIVAFILRKLPSPILHCIHIVTKGPIHVLLSD